VSKELVQKAQERGINMSEDEDGSWHGSFIHDGQEYTLDNETVEGLSDDMNALVDILGQDDTYTVDYNEDADRYIVTANGFATPFSDQVLAKAFAAAQDAVMGKLAKEEDERKKREAKEAKAAAPKPAPKPAKSNGEGATASPPSAPAAGSAIAVGDLPLPVSDAVIRLINALTDLVSGAAGRIARQDQPQGEGFVAAGAEAPAPTRKKKGLGKSA
jgi:uncharacterized protein (DUF885 family)